MFFLFFEIALLFLGQEWFVGYDGDVDAILGWLGLVGKHVVGLIVLSGGASRLIWILRIGKSATLGWFLVRLLKIVTQ